MGRNAKKVMAACGLLVLLLATPSLLSLWVFHELQERLKLKGHGHFVPVFWAPAFWVRKGDFEWRKTLKLSSGDIKVEYHPFLVFQGGRLRVRLSGEDLEVRALDDAVKLQGIEKIPVDSFSIELVVGPEGLEGIYGMEVDSPQFQFHLKNSDNLIPVRGGWHKERAV